MTRGRGNSPLDPCTFYVQSEQTSVTSVTSVYFRYFVTSVCKRITSDCFRKQSDDCQTSISRANKLKADLNIFTSFRLSIVNEI
jgi:hypothetical protein